MIDYVEVQKEHRKIDKEILRMSERFAYLTSEETMKLREMKKKKMRLKEILSEIYNG